MELWCDSCRGYVQAVKEEAALSCRFCGHILTSTTAEAVAVADQRVWQNGYDVGRHVGAMEMGRMLINRYEIDVAKLNQMLAVAVRLCLYAINGHCLKDCIVQEYCQPERLGLTMLE